MYGNRMEVVGVIPINNSKNETSPLDLYLCTLIFINYKVQTKRVEALFKYKQLQGLDWSWAFADPVLLVRLITFLLKYERLPSCQPKRSEFKNSAGFINFSVEGLGLGLWHFLCFLSLMCIVLYLSAAVLSRVHCI